MLWHVENSFVHILGSVHVSNRPLELSKQMSETVGAAEVLAFETNIDATPDLALARFANGESLSQQIPASLYDDTRRLWNEHNLNSEELQRLRPWWVALYLMNAVMARRGFEGSRGIDRQLFSLGKDTSKTLFFFEPISAGFIPFRNAPAHEHDVLLAQVAQHTEEGMRDIELIVSAWQSRSPENLLPIVERALARTPVTYSGVLFDRNKAWLRHLKRLIRSGKRTVAVVGALHMVGPSSLPTLLAATGQKCVLVG